MLLKLFYFSGDILFATGIVIVLSNELLLKSNHPISDYRNVIFYVLSPLTTNYLRMYKIPIISFR